MTTFEFVIAIVAIVLFFSLVREVIRRRHGASNLWEEWLDGSGLGDLADQFGEDGLGAKLDRIDSLEKRIEVLERIATDKTRSLAEEIERL